MDLPDSLETCLSDKKVADEIKRHIVSAAWLPLRLHNANFKDISEEIYQRVCLIALSKARGGEFVYSSQRTTLAWLMRIAVHVILSLRRDGAKERLRTVSSSALDPSEWKDISVDRADTHVKYEEILETMKGLPPRQREVFKLRFLEQFMGDELAERLGIAKGSAAAMASLSKRKFVELWEQRKKEVVQ